MESPQEQMGRAKMEQQKLAAEESYYGEQAGGIAAGPRSLIGEDKPSQPHPREVLLSQINDQEQKLLDKLMALRELRREFNCLSRSEAEQFVKVSKLAERVGY